MLNTGKMSFFYFKFSENELYIGLCSIIYKKIWIFKESFWYNIYKRLK